MVLRSIKTIMLFCMLSAMSSTPRHDVHKTKAFGDYFKYYLTQDTIGRRGVEQVYWNALFAGRYDYLSKLNNRSDWGQYQECATPNSTRIADPVSRVITEAKNYRVLAFNESHTQLQQRFLLLQNLQLFWNAGYRHLGYEAYRAGDVGVDYEQPDQIGFHFHEPLLAATLRKARSLGFQVFGYENKEATPVSFDWAEAINFREARQAKRLAAYVSSVPENEKILVWAGGHHITKNKDQEIEGRVLQWMASRLKHDHSISIYSVDLTNCQFMADQVADAVRGYQSYVNDWWVSELFQQWGVDAQIRLPLVSKQNAAADLYRRHIGKKVMIPDSIRGLADIIFVQAFDKSPNNTVTAYDSILLFKGEMLPLYLPSGEFKLIAYGSDGMKLGESSIFIE